MPEQDHFPESSERYAEGRRITLVSVIVNAVLTAMQIVVGVFAHSQALVADAMHTLSDVIADGFVLWANRRSAEAADADHPYGHGRYETAASLVLGLLLVMTGLGILLSAVERLANIDKVPAVGVAALWAALFTLAAKEGLFRYMLGVAKRLRSPMLVANAWHARADALSSLVVAAGVGGSLVGLTFADAVAALIVGGMIVKAGGGFAWEAMRELIDTGLSEEEVARLRETLGTTPGVVGLHELRTRRMGHQVLIDAHVQVDPRISVSEGHRIGEAARCRVLAAHPHVLDVLVHVDAENDLATAPSCIQLPEREALVSHLRQMLGDESPPPERMVFHFLGNRVEAEILLPPDDNPARLERLRIRLMERLPGDPYFTAIDLHSRIAPK